MSGASAGSRSPPSRGGGGGGGGGGGRGGGGGGDNNNMPIMTNTNTNTNSNNAAAAVEIPTTATSNPSSPAATRTTTSINQAPSLSPNPSSELMEMNNNIPNNNNNNQSAAQVTAPSMPSSSTSTTTVPQRINPFEVPPIVSSSSLTTAVPGSMSAAPVVTAPPPPSSAAASSTSVQVLSAAAAASSSANAAAVAAPVQVDRGGGLLLATSSSSGGSGGTMSVDSSTFQQQGGIIPSAPPSASPDRSINHSSSSSKPSSPQMTHRPPTVPPTAVAVAAAAVIQQQQQQQPQTRPAVPAQAVTSIQRQQQPQQQQQQQQQQPVSTPTRTTVRPPLATTTTTTTAAPVPPLPQELHYLPNRSRTHNLGFDDDENTEPSSAVNSAGHNSNEDRQPPRHHLNLQNVAGIDAVAGSFARFLETTRRRINSNTSFPVGGGGGHARNGGGDGGSGNDSLDNDNVQYHNRRRLSGERGMDPEDEDDEGVVGGGYDNTGALICGYLKKLGRNGKWQTRWFETDGECLSYYKNNKRTQLLATLDLEKVGTITIDEEDTKGHSFHIQVLGRLYQLRADSKAACKDWVITLNRIKEAHLQQGNVKLVSSGHSHKNIRHHFAPVDLLDTQSNGDFGTPRVVVVSNRQRTRAVAESQDFDQLIRLKDGQGEEEDPAITSHLSAAYGGAEKRLSTVGAVVLTRWTKRKSSLSHLGSKLRTWALSMRHLSCAHSISAVHGLDRHVHPPGHDYTSSTLAARRPHNSAGNNIDNRESSSGDRGTGALGGGSDGAWIADETDSNDDDAVAAEPGSSAQHDERSRPRRMSSASEDIRVLS